ncbi:MAG: tRNA (adenosine(37)-N6)-dimethylallyltransferase MiaA, partial [Planctomycetes bacterium]|nr:tRNA (adenosine(37)-N6)-dimethylallyltransferase MiaA [Planctomycetota bacterium]
MYNRRNILILGVTASGKGALGFELARRLNGEIISIDS